MRSLKLDTLKGFLIILVILGHVISQCGELGGGLIGKPKFLFTLFICLYLL